MKTHKPFRRVKAGLWLLFVLGCLGYSHLLKAQAVPDEPTIPRSAFLGINPYKPFLGLPNLAFEQQVTGPVSVFTFAEHLIPQQRIQPNGHEHPRFVFQLSVRYYVSVRDPLSGLYVGFINGFTLKRARSNQHQGYLSGLEIGYKWLPGRKKAVYLEPRILTTINVGRKNPLDIGAELQAGLRFGRR
ncbi:hypothetical protein ACO2Q8_12770 [Larkinella sp. VNQ87]|uniref:hypothetical protein n=1 Tax=Larkinella sp. VNQ87 TaxID=3400921 RepID=UPI003C05F6A4